MSSLCETSSGLDEEQLPALDGAPPPQKTTFSWRPLAATALGAALCLLAGASLASEKFRVTRSGTSAAPLTVRSLLESTELAELAADNLMAMGGGDAAMAPSLGPRDAVRAHVWRSFLNISQEIRQSDPEAHQGLDALLVSPEQKECITRVLRYYGDARMLRLSVEMNDAIKETIQAKGDHKHLKRVLFQKFQPKIGEMRQLAEEMFPGSGAQLTLDLDKLNLVHRFKQWHLNTQGSSSRTASARQLTSTSNADGAVKAQAATFFRTLELNLGDRMPKAPARMLFFGFPSSSSSTRDGIGNERSPVPDHQSFMSCVTRAASSQSLTGVLKCISDNIKEVIEMMINFVEGKSRLTGRQ